MLTDIYNLSKDMQQRSYFQMCSFFTGTLQKVKGGFKFMHMPMQPKISTLLCLHVPKCWNFAYETSKVSQVSLNCFKFSPIVFMKI